MPQSLALGNGNLLVNFDHRMQMTDVYYPHVGQENHSEFGTIHRVGIWIDEAFSWLSDDGWTSSIEYEKNTLVGNATLRNEDLGIELHFQDFVYTTYDILFRRVQVTNLRDYDREVKLYFGHDFYLYGDKTQDTAQYEPQLHGVLHYRRKRYFFVGGEWSSTGHSMSEYSVGKSNYGDREGTWKDAEDGHLHNNPIEQGSVDSVVGFYTMISAQQSLQLDTWIIAGKHYADIEEGYKRIHELGVERIYSHTKDYWESWCQKGNFDLPGISKPIKDLWQRSLLLVRTQIDNQGAIIASNDSDIMKFNKDTYTYMWPRDGALVSMALSRTGYWGIVQRFLLFCQKIVTKEGYVLHKYNPDKSLGSSWHPKIRNGNIQLPIQEDESALILVAMWEFYQNSQMMETVKNMFDSVVLKIGHFLQTYIDEKTGLPKQSYDLWEEQYGVFSYTVSTVYAGLKAAENLSRVTGHMYDAKSFAKSAASIKKAMIKHLYCEEHKRFGKRVEMHEDGHVLYDPTVDASLAFVWEMGVLEPDDPMVVQTMQTIEKDLKIHTEVGGYARYTGDYYHRNYDHQYSADVPGNPWLITTLWVANWYIVLAKKRSDLKKAKELIDWTASKANEAGIMPEQIDPFTNEPLSVAPLTWSHATFVDTVLRYSQKWEELK